MLAFFVLCHVNNPLLSSDCLMLRLENRMVKRLANTSVLDQRRKVSQHLVSEAFVSLSFHARERNVFVAMRIRHAHRFLHLRVDRIAGRAKSVLAIRTTHR
jgi:hypothetical protein